MEYQAPALPHALTEPSLGALRDVNESVLALICAIAIDYDAEPGCFHLPFIARRQLTHASAEARSQLARLPALLVDIEFRHVEWWQHVTMRRVRNTAPTGPQRLTHRGALRALAKSVLTYAWTVVQQDRIGARIVLGMSDPVIDVIAAVGPMRMQHVASHALWHMRPRWQDRPTLWQHLLHEAAHPDTLRLAQIQCLQQLDASALRGVRPTVPTTRRT